MIDNFHMSLSTDTVELDHSWGGSVDSGAVGDVAELPGFRQVPRNRRPHRSIPSDQVERIRSLPRMATLAVTEPFRMWPDLATSRPIDDSAMDTLAEIFANHALAATLVKNPDEARWDLYVVVRDHSDEAYKRLYFAERSYCRAFSEPLLSVHVRAARGRRVEDVLPEVGARLF